MISISIAIKLMIMQGVEDNTTIATFSVKVYYSIEAGEQARDKIGNMVEGMIGQMNKRFEELGVLTKVRLHCLEQMTWSEKEVFAAFGGVGSFQKYKHWERNSADAVMYLTTNTGSSTAIGFGILGAGLRSSFKSFDSRLVSWIKLGYVAPNPRGLNVAVHELGHNLGLNHKEMKNGSYYREVFKTLRFALAAVGDESEACPKQEAAWEFRSGCFKNFGSFTGDKLENEDATEVKTAKACQARCAATDSCQFFSFKEVADILYRGFIHQQDDIFSLGYRIRIISHAFNF